MMLRSAPPLRHFRGIMLLAILIWGLVLAAGAWRYRGDWRTGGLVLCCVAGFLGLWWVTIRRVERLRGESDEP